MSVDRKIIFHQALAKQLEPTIPCYITGHSLGAAVATLVAMEIAQQVPQLKDQIQLYTFAGPRVGSPKFVQAHSQLIPILFPHVKM
ncbi:MAG: hypothetical protein AB4206_11275 [Xenococcaceae cyanobacterium]